MALDHNGAQTRVQQEAARRYVSGKKCFFGRLSVRDANGKQLIKVGITAVHNVLRTNGHLVLYSTDVFQHESWSIIVQGLVINLY